MCVRRIAAFGGGDSSRFALRSAVLAAAALDNGPASTKSLALLTRIQAKTPKQYVPIANAFGSYYGGDLCHNRPELGDVSRGEVVSINNYYRLFKHLLRDRKSTRLNSSHSQI